MKRNAPLSLTDSNVNTTSDIGDERDRLMTETNELDKTCRFEHDRNGNRTESHLHGSDYVTGENNQLNSDGIYTYTYDDQGNMKTQTSIATGIVEEFEWDYRNRLTAIITRDTTGTITQQVNYIYDVMGRRIAKTIDADGIGSEDPTTTHFVYNGNNVLMEFVDDGTTPSQRYLHGPQIDQILAQDNGTGQPQWLLADHLGTVHDVIDNSGTILNHITFDSFGTVLNQTDDTFSTRYLFTGREFDDETGLYYYRARYYSPQIGQFISQDPIGFSGGINLYEYAENNPILQRDPSGLRPTTGRENLMFERMEQLAQVTASTPSGGVAGVGGHDLAQRIRQSAAELQSWINAVPVGQDDPIRLEATLWALDQWDFNAGSWCFECTVSNYGEDVRTFREKTNKCNRFVGDAYAIGADLGYTGDGFPTGEPAFYDPRPGYPLSAETLAESSSSVPNFPVTDEPRIGDIISFGSGHTGILLGNGLYISAREGERLGDDFQVYDGVQITIIPGSQSYNFRTYDP